MDEEPFDNGYEGRRPNYILALLLLILIGSPGTLILFVAFSESAPLLLTLATPLTLGFVYWYIRIFRAKPPTQV